MPAPSIASLLRHPALVASVVAVGLSLVLAACGGSDSSSGTNAGATMAQGGQGGRRPGFNLTADQQACLKKEGVTLGGGRGGYGGGRPGGQRPQGAPLAGAGAERFQKMRAAMEKCGIKLPSRPKGAPGQGYGQRQREGQQGQPPAQGQSDPSGSSSTT